MLSKSALVVPNSGRWKIGSRLLSSSRMSRRAGSVDSAGSILGCIAVSSTMARLSATMTLSDDAARNHRLGRVVVELHGEAEHQGVQVAVLGGEVEAEDVARRFDRV